MPDVPHRMGLGVGLDLPWGADIGWGWDKQHGNRINARVLNFLQRHDFAYLFVSWQPRNRNRLKPEDYTPVFDDLFERAPAFKLRALHQTAFNLGALEPYDRSALIAFTNALIERYGLSWVNEDLGLWSIHGRSLPYPLPPYLTPQGLSAAIANTAEVQQALAAPLLVEFPGFSEGTNFYMGRMDAYDFFREVVEQTASPCTLDIGHLLSWQWLQGNRGTDLYKELERLPLKHCFEIHLSGCAIARDRFLDVHHGILLDEQLELLQMLAPMCPNLRCITYEDPRFGEDGQLIAKSVANFERLNAYVSEWAA